MSGAATTRRTAQAGAVHDALAEAAAFVSAQDVYARLRAGGQPVGLSTVYRHLRSLADQGAADVIVTPDGEATYRYCQAAGKHHHHLVCRQCGRAEEIQARAVERWAATIAEKFGYTHTGHTIEVFGTCRDCTS